MDKVVSLVVKMKKLKVTPNLVTHHMLIRAFRHRPRGLIIIIFFFFFVSKLKQTPLFPDAKRILEKTKKLGWVPPVDAYTVVITAMAYVNLNEALELLRELKSKHGSEMLRNAYTSLILAIGKKKGARHQALQEGLSFFRKASALGLTLDSVAYSAAISLAMHHNDWSLAEKV